MHTAGGLVVLLGGPGDFTWQHFLGNLGLLLDKAQEASQKFLPLFSFRLFCPIQLKWGQTLWEGKSWDRQHDLDQPAAPTALH